ncbi:hypothetical protein [Pseudaeromonas paramecii]|uniref:hypothetical protein n=1 Tax=Pseudaeromonas paramecii TaxID=2138166 RepID=UPI0031EAC5D7
MRALFPEISCCSSGVFVIFTPPLPSLAGGWPDFLLIKRVSLVCVSFISALLLNI